MWQDQGRLRRICPSPDTNKPESEAIVSNTSCNAARECKLKITSVSSTMNIQTYASVASFDVTPNPTAQAKLRWGQDISAFDALVEKARQISALQTVLMEYVRETTDLLKRQSQVHDLSFAKTRKAFTASRPDTAHKIAAKNITATEDSLKKAKAKLSETDQKLKDIAQRSRLLERKILTHEPEDQNEAIIMIQFLSRLFKAHGKVEDEYLSHVLEACAQATVSPQDGFAMKPYPQLAAA